MYRVSTRRNDLNYIRFFAFSLIIIYHFMIESETRGVFSFTEHGIFYLNRNMHIASLGVGLFFLLSGAGLYLSSRKGIDLHEFYNKRFERILIPFYVTYLGSLCMLLILRRSLPFTGKTPILSVVFSLFGMDEYFSLLGIPTFTLGIGEWFLGALMIIYLIYPLIFRLFTKNKNLFMAMMTLYYLLLVFFYPFKIQMITNVCVKIFEFILGMFIMSFWLEHELDHRKIKTIIGIASLAVICFYLFVPIAIPLPEDLGVTILSLAVLLLFMTLNEHLAKMCHLSRAIALVCRYTFEIYLVHHLIIYQFSLWFEDSILSPTATMGLFLLELIVMIIAGTIVRSISAFIGKQIQSAAQ